eukprot:Rhum_TRINITY_DN14920_c9_g1::Rhum_TRINITY_DN14920_c9_g1_i1::g.127623::m.127623
MLRASVLVALCAATALGAGDDANATRAPGSAGPPGAGGPPGPSGPDGVGGVQHFPGDTEVIPVAITLLPLVELLAAKYREETGEVVTFASGGHSQLSRLLNDNGNVAISMESSKDMSSTGALSEWHREMLLDKQRTVTWAAGNETNPKKRRNLDIKVNKLHQAIATMEEQMELLRKEPGKRVALEVIVGAMPILIIFNVPNLPKLTITEETLFQILNGTIVRWNDPRIVCQQPQAMHINHPITVVGIKPHHHSSVIISDKKSERDLNSSSWNMTAANHDEVIAYVSSTNYSIGYAAASATIENAMKGRVVAQVAIRNSMETETFASLRDVERSFNHSINMMRVVSGTKHPPTQPGYPFVAFLNVVLGKKATCHSLAFVMWLLTSPDAKRIMSDFTALQTPSFLSTPEFSKLASKKCITKERAHLSTPIGLKIDEHCLSCESNFWALGYSYAKQTKFKAFVRVLGDDQQDRASEAELQVESLYATAATSPMLAIHGEDTARSAAMKGAVLPFSLHTVVVVVNTGVYDSEVTTIELAFEDMHSIFTGNMTQSARQRVFGGGRAMLVTTFEWLHFGTIFKGLGLDEQLAKDDGYMSDTFPHRVFAPDEIAIAVHMSSKVGTWAVMDLAIARQYGLTILIPTIRGVPTPPGKEARTKSLLKEAALAEQWLGEGNLPAYSPSSVQAPQDRHTLPAGITMPEEYPFVRLHYLAFPWNAPALSYVYTDEALLKMDQVTATHDPRLTEAALESLGVRFSAHLSSPFEYHGSFGAGGEPLTKVRATGCDPAPYLLVAWLYSHAGAASRYPQELVDLAKSTLLRATCDGARMFFPIEGPREKSTLSLQLLVSIASLSALLMLMLLALGWYLAREKYKGMYGQATLADFAEDLCRLDFHKHSLLTDLPHPDQIQKAMAAIYQMTQDLVQFVPSAVMQFTIQSANASADPGASDARDVVVVDPGPASPAADSQAPCLSPHGGPAHLHRDVGHALDAVRSMAILSIRPHVSTQLAAAADPSVLYVSLLEQIHRVVDAEEGFIHSLAGDRITAAWGSLGEKVKKRSALAAAVAILATGSHSTPSAHIGAYFGTASCTVVDSVAHKFKAFWILGGIEEADCLARVAYLAHAPCLLRSSAVTVDVRECFAVSLFFKTQSARRGVRGSKSTMMLLKKLPWKLSRLQFRHQAACLQDATQAQAGIIPVLTAAVQGNREQAADLLAKTIKQACEWYLLLFLKWLDTILPLKLIDGGKLVLSPGNASNLYSASGQLVSTLKGSADSSLSEAIRLHTISDVNRIGKAAATASTPATHSHSCPSSATLGSSRGKPTSI